MAIPTILDRNIETQGCHTCSFGFNKYRGKHWNLIYYFFLLSIILVYHEKIKSAGVNSEMILVPGVVHAFFTFPGKLNTFVPVQNIDKNK